MKENSGLKNQLEDTITTLQINKDLLFKYIAQEKTYSEKNSLITELQEEHKRQTEQMNKIYNEKMALEKNVLFYLYNNFIMQLYKHQQMLENKSISNKDALDKTNEQIFILENKLIEKESIIAYYKSELKKYQECNSSSTKEIFLSEPDRTNLELYNELNYSRDLIAKLSKILNQEKLKVSKLESNKKELEEKIINLKKGRKISKNMNNISILDYISSDEDKEENLSNLNDSCYLALESPIVKFEEKIKMKKKIYQSYSTNNDTNNITSVSKNVIPVPIPKLDLSIVKAKYHNAKNMEIAAVNNHKITNRSSNEYIDKLKFELKVCKNTVKIVRKKLDKYKRILEVHKQTIEKLRNKNEFLELQLKKSTGSTNDDVSLNKKDINNTSMVKIVNTSNFLE